MKITLLIASFVLSTLTLLQPVFAQDETPPPSNSITDGIVETTVEATEGTAGMRGTFLNRVLTSPKSEIVHMLLVVGGVISCRVVHLADFRHRPLNPLHRVLV